VLRSVFEHKRKEVRRGWRKLQNDELYNFPPDYYRLQFSVKIFHKPAEEGRLSLR
jgi:hypothetical protein